MRAVASAGEAMTADYHDEETDHLDDVEDGSGCTELWEHLSEHRAEADHE